MARKRTIPLRGDSIEPEACTPELRRQILRGLPFFRALSGPEMARLYGSFGEVGFEPGEIITQAGSPVDRLYVVAHGKLVVVHPMPAGQEVLLEVLAQGDFFGSLTSAEAAAASADTVRAQTAGCLLTIAGRQFRRILETHPPVALAVLEITAERLRRAQEAIRHLSVSPTEVRIAHALLRLAEKLGTRDAGGVLIQVPLSREDLAGLTGTTPETVSRTLSRFQREKRIETGRRWVRVRDPEALARLTGAV